MRLRQPRRFGQPLTPRGWCAALLLAAAIVAATLAWSLP